MPPSERSLIDLATNSIIALHGLTGHAWNTFTKAEVLDSDGSYTQEINWLRDLLPDLLNNYDSSITYRIMTFGFDASVWMSKSVADIDTYVGNLLNYLDVERQDVSALLLVDQDPIDVDVGSRSTTVVYWA